MQRLHYLEEAMIEVLASLLVVQRCASATDFSFTDERAGASQR